MKNISEISKKICMLGSFGVGKTSLVRRFVYNRFDEKYLSTIGVQISQKTIELPSRERERLRFILWDIAHIEKFSGPIKNYFQGAHGAIIVFDLTRTKTYQQTDSILKPFLSINPTCKLIFVGNKIDLIEKNSVNLEQLLHFKNKYKAAYILTSAKTGENVEQLFLELGRSLIEED